MDKVKPSYPQRTDQGFQHYISGMEKSAFDKTRVFPFVREGIIVDMGAGAGPFSALLSRKFPQSKIIAVDHSQRMIAKLQQRFQHLPKVEVIHNEAQTFSYSEKVNTILFISVLHEIFSFARYSHKEVIKTLKNAQRLLSPGGRIIIRDGVHPEQTVLYLKPRHKEAYQRFLRFVKEFQVRPIVFTQGSFQGDSFLQEKAENFGKFQKRKLLIEIASQDLSEFLSKYFYPFQNWPIELTEQFGIWTLREYQHILLDLGFFVSYAEVYVLDYLLKNHYQKDFVVFKLENGQLVNSTYPPSTMILVGEKL